MADADSAATAGADPATSGWKAWLIGKAKISFDYLTTKEYERVEVGKNPKLIKNSRRVKLRGYITICLVGLGTMHWGGAEKVLGHMSKDKSNKELANMCVRFLTFAFNCSLLGLTAGTFPTTAPWALFFGGLGGWQSLLFILALFHLETS